jgi:DNA-binding HxlR family transcriptional regulator
MSATSPVSTTAKILASRWTFEIIYHLRQPRRFCELQELVGGVNPRTFSDRLKFLEEQGLVSRQPLSETARVVHYSLTERGEELIPILDDLSAWAGRWVIQEQS